MGSQTLEILRQGVWASLTGGWFYDPHQSVFCNVVHLYLWLFLLCTPFVAYLYFPETWLTWCIYCILTSVTVLLLKVANMALHRLYDRAQSMSEANIKQHFFKVTKETATERSRNNEPDIEMKVMHVGDEVDMAASVDKAINELSAENSMVSIDNVNSIIDLKVDVHRKNSSESIELMFYAPSLMSANSQQDQQSLAGTASNSKSIRSSHTISHSSQNTNNTNNNNSNSLSITDPQAKYISVYPKDNSPIASTSSNSNNNNTHAANSLPVSALKGPKPPHLVRKSSEILRGHQRRRLERQSSLDAAAESAVVAKLLRQSSDTSTNSKPTTSTTLTLNGNGEKYDNFLHAQISKAACAAGPAAPNTNTGTVVQSQRSNTTTLISNSLTAGATAGLKTTRLQRHRSSETHDERLKQQQRGGNSGTAGSGTGGGAAYLSIHHEHGQHNHHHHHHHHRHHHRRGGGMASSGSVVVLGSGVNCRDSYDVDDMELGLGGSANVVAQGSLLSGDSRMRALPSWILGSSSDVFIEDDSFTKSDLGIEQLEDRSGSSSTRVHPHSNQYRLNHAQQTARSASITKDPIYTISALQLHKRPRREGAIKRRRHSNATTLFKSPTDSSSNVGSQPTTATTVRRIKSAALEVACPRPSVSNLCPHPNSVEAINGQQQIKNPQNALLPPPSKCLVRNPHLNLCPKFGGSFGGSSTTNSSLDFGSTNALIDTAFLGLKEQKDKQKKLEAEKEESSPETKTTAAEGSLDDDSLGAVGGVCPHHYLHAHSQRSHHHSAESDVGQILNDDKNDDDDEEDVEEREHKSDQLQLENDTDNNGEDDEAEDDEDEEEDEEEEEDDDDEFKDFDYNVEHILEVLEHTHNQLDDDLRNNQQQKQIELNKLKGNNMLEQQASDKISLENRKAKEEEEEDEEEDGLETEAARALRERLHSTDSETDNNGSRSPLLSTTKKWSCTAKEKNSEKLLKEEVKAIQKQKHSLNKQTISLKAKLEQGEGEPEKGAGAALANDPEPPPPNNQRRNEADSGCPSSDCEQISASSKDILLSSMELVKTTKDHALNELPLTSAGLMASSSNSAVAKRLGAIPKQVQYREIDERAVGGGGGGADTLQVTGGCAHNYKRHAGNWSAVAPTASQPTQTLAAKGISRTSSSSNSSHSVSADSFTADIHKMLWLMHGGTVDERGRPINNENTAATMPTPALNPGNMSNAHLQFYQDALKALNSASSAEKLALSERLYHREQLLRRSSRQKETESSQWHIECNEPVPNINATTTTAATSLQQVMIDSPSSSANVLNNRNVSTATTVSLKGFIQEIINDELRNLGSSQRVGSSSLTAANNNAAMAAILNVEGHHIENYCDYWRPACMLSAEKPSVAPKSFYKYRFKLGNFRQEFKISMDRLELLALFDRDIHWIHIVLSVFLSAGVAYLGCSILQYNYYKDVFAFLFCAVIAGSQYSLLKSVQPDAASPIHGFNKTVAYSRAIYFCMCSGLLLLFQKLQLAYNLIDAQGAVQAKYTFYGIEFQPSLVNEFVLQVLYIFLLCFPLIFSLGLFPQINTFTMYLMEQIDMHVFGGNAAGSLKGSILCVVRSFMGVLLLYGPLYAAFHEGKGTQHIIFSIFCALLVPLGYHLSRSASDFSHIWAIVKNCIMSTYHEDDDELSSTSTQKLTTSTPKRNASGKKCIDENTQQSENIEMSSLEKIGENVEKTMANDTTAAADTDKEQNSLVAQKRSKSKASSLSSSSSQTLGKTLSTSKKAITASSSSCNSNLETESNLKEDQAEQNHKKENLAKETETDKMSTSSNTNPAEMSTLTGIINENDNEVFTMNCVDVSSASAETESNCDPLPKKLQYTVNTRLKNDFVVTIFLAVVVLGLHCSTVFTVLQPDLNIVLYGFTGALGFLLHYVIPQMRKHMPWLCFAKPLMRQKEYGRYEVTHAPKIMWFEKFYIYLCLLEKNVLFPLLAISALTADAYVIAGKYGIAWGTVIVAICALKFIRNAYSDPTNQYLIVMFTVLFFRIDFALASETFLIDYFFVSLAFRKCCDFFLKLQFIVTYIAPWQITWGSAFHAFAQPFSVPHSAMLFLQAGISSLLSTPLNPFLGSAIFLTSYVRPIKFWERDYNTRRIDHSNTRLSSQLERDLGADDNNLNSIFYEHLTRSLQHSLCGDLLMGRWGNVNQGDCFVLASDYLNCLVHIIELGNGLCTFQMRGLEFRGTYCQQREVEAITEDVEDNDGCCCCDPGHLPRMLSANAMFSTRWLAWQVVASQYVVEGYSISDNLASATLQVFEYRKVLITYYVKSIIYYVIKNNKLDEWLNSSVIQEALQHTMSRQFVDLDPIFNFNLDEDFDFRAVGITRTSFCYVYLSWLNYCYDKRKESLSPTRNATQNPTPTAAHAVTTTQPQPTATASTSTLASTPNLSTAQQKSQSQQQLKIRPQKSATMTGSNEGVVNSVDQMATSHSLANISRQTSESAPGLTTTTTPLTRSSKSAPTASKHGYPKSDYSPSTRQEARAASAEPSRGTTQEKISQIKLKVPSIAKDSPIVSLCLALSLLARRSLATASHSSLTGVEFFLHGLHALFKGDFRITSPRDEWVFADMDLLHAVVAPAVKMALKLQQDHISNPDEFRDPDALFEAIDTCAKDLVISHEADPVWRSAVLRGAPNLLALRHVMEDGSDEYRIIRLTKRFLTFRVIKLNRECVRGLWAGQQQELIYLRNRNPERGSIQNAKQALRNIINSSCDQPIGYPIYVSPLTTSYADTNEQLKDVIGGPITPEAIKTNILDWWHRIREKCRQGCSSGSSIETTHLGLPSGACSNLGESGDLRPVYISPPIYNTLTASTMFSLAATGVPGATLSSQFGSDGLSSMRSSITVIKPSSTTLLAGLLNREQELLRESRSSSNKQQLSGSSIRSSERERRATLPIASSSSVLPEVIKDSDDSSQTLDKLNASNDSVSGGNGGAGGGGGGGAFGSSSGSPRYTKIYCSSGNLGIGNIITNPGDYPRKTKGPICLTAAAAAAASVQQNPANNANATNKPPPTSIALLGGGEVGASSNRTTQQEQQTVLPRFGRFEKVIIVDEREIFQNIDQCRRMVWPFEALRQKGGPLSWDGWEPRAGMVGYVIHIWRPNHPNKMYRTPFNRDVYLIEIGKNYVPVTASGLRQYNQAMDSNQREIETSRRNSLQREMNELRQQHIERGLTPILGSSLESPTSLIAEGERNTAVGHHKAKIQAVSSSSSEDESCLLILEKVRQEAYLKNIWDQVFEQEQKNMKDDIENVATNLTNKLAAHEQLATSINTNETTTTRTLDENTSSTQAVNNQTESPSTAPNDEHILIKESSQDSGQVCAKEFVDQLVDHVVDKLCNDIDSETDVEKSELLKEEQEEKEEEAGKADHNVRIIEITADENTNELNEENLDREGIVYNI